MTFIIKCINMLKSFLDYFKGQGELATIQIATKRKFSSGNILYVCNSGAFWSTIIKKMLLRI